MKKITAKYITENTEKMRCGHSIIYRGSEFFINVAHDPDLIMWINSDRKLSGAINGHEYARIIDGVPYRI